MGFAEYIGTRRGRVSCSIVLASAVILAIFVHKTLVDPTARQYRLDFGSAKWIQLRGTKPSLPGYFRGTVYIPGPVTQAWLQISATGNYKLYVNDVFLDRNEFACVRPTGVYDLKQIIAPGKNVIAVYVAGAKFTGPAQLLVRGLYTVASSAPRKLVSDLSWKVSSTPDGIIGSYPWSSPALIDTTWRNVVYGDPGERFSTVQPVPFDPQVIEGVPFAKWIGSASPAQQASFSRHLNLPWRRGETWLQVAATGAYDVMINGVPVVSQPAIAQTELVGPEAPTFAVPGSALPQSQMSKAVVPKSIVAGALTPSFTMPRIRKATPQAYPNLVSLSGATSTPDKADAADMAAMPDLTDIAPPLQQPAIQLVPYQVSLGMDAAAALLTAYNVTTWMRAGDNTIQIRVRTHYGAALLFAQGYTYVKDARVTFRTDEQWRTLALSPGTVSEVGGAAMVVADYGTVPWGPLPQVLANPQSLPGQNFRLFVWGFTTVLGVIALVGLMWLYVPKLIAGLGGYDADLLWTADALLHLPLLCGLLFLWMLSYDARIRSDWCFTLPVLIGASVYIVASKLLLLFAPERSTVSTEPASVLARLEPRHYWYVAGLTIIVLVGLAIRAAGLLDASMAHDETALILMSWGVLKVGFPFVQAGSYTKWLSTYELVPYPLALSSLIFGVTPFAYRLPALIFGTSTIALIGWVGYRMMDWRVGLVSALIYACLPMPILWARDGFYPSQHTFFVLLTFWCFYEAIRERGLNGRFVTLTGVTFMLTYLSWEGSAFIMVAMFLSILILKWGEYDWMLDGHLWRVFATVAVLVLIQLFWRMWVTAPDYLGVVVTLSQISTPSLAFLNRLAFEPYFYLQCELFVENHFLLTLLVLIGIPIAWRSRPLLYLYLSLAALEISYTGFLAHDAPRYGFFWTPVLVLAGVGSFFYIWDSIAELPAFGSVFAASRFIGLCAGIVMLILGTNPFILKLYRLSLDDPSALHYFCRLGAGFKFDYHSSDDYVARHAAPDDIIISDGPGAHVFFFYHGYWPNFSMDSLLSNRIIYDGGRRTPSYTDKVGMPLIRDLDQLVVATAQGRRVWVMTHGGDSPEVHTFTQRRGRYVFESGGQRVFEMTGAGPPRLVGSSSPTAAVGLRQSRH